ncbi:cyclase family protein [Ramlibacter monticola]|uniref:Cyclase family protein n=1 Tax=Ramlibacter monticola TaxID=1926872 RepID=A0A936YWL7_9BURK|nr:cyclase family protein [Ramlibacter monticola]MBL0390141.1 cyclase family protein [Ramlibacter monticola]
MSGAPGASRWRHRPPQSNWGDFGADDELGRLNLITPECVLRATREVRTGQSFCLSLPLDLPGGNVLNPRRHPPQLRPTLREGRSVFNLPIGDASLGQTDVLCDDAVLIHTQYSTQWDGFSHVGHLFDVDGSGVAQAVYYNGFRAGEDLIGADDPQGRPSGARRLGVDVFAAKAIQTRGVLVDLKAIAGQQRVRIGYDDFMRALDACGVQLESGDILCLYTGFADLVLQAAGAPDPSLHRQCAVLDGRDQRLLQWIVDSGIAALCADNYGVEEIPAGGPCECGPRLPLHELCLFKQGIPLGELWYLKELKSVLDSHKRSAFMLTAPPLRLPGAVGSPVTPVATI